MSGAAYKNPIVLKATGQNSVRKQDDEDKDTERRSYTSRKLK